MKTQNCCYSLRTLLLVLFLGCSSYLASANQICPLCGDPSKFPKRWDYILEINPVTTCQDVFFYLGSKTPDHKDCQPMVEKYGSKCCDAKEPDPIDLPPTPPPVYDGGAGDEPECKICGNDEYPGKPSAFIVARYVGEYTCGQLYDRGLNGLIPGFMCTPLQDFAYPVCGCGEYNPNKNPVPAPVAAPTDKPNPAPVAAPTDKPNPAPVQTPKPTPRPTNLVVPTAVGIRKVKPESNKNNMKLAPRSSTNDYRGSNRRQLSETDAIPEV